MTDKQIDDLDWAGVSEDMARQVLALGEKYLESQLQAALAADQRAVTSASIFSGIAAAILAVSIAVWADDHNSTPFLVAGLSTAITLTVSAFFCWHAARPVDFYFAGAHPRMWWDVRCENLAEIMGGQSEHYQSAIDDNAKTIQQNAGWLARGIRFGIVSPIIGFSFWILASWYQVAFSPA